METVWRDIRLALRSLRHSATFTVAVMATLGISIGMATAMFTVYRTVLIDRFPIAAQDRSSFCTRSIVTGRILMFRMRTYLKSRATVRCSGPWQGCTTRGCSPRHS